LILLLVGLKGQEVDEILGLKSLARNEVRSELDEELGFEEKTISDLFPSNQKGGRREILNLQLEEQGTW